MNANTLKYRLLKKILGRGQGGRDTMERNLGVLLKSLALSFFVVYNLVTVNGLRNTFGSRIFISLQ